MCEGKWREEWREEGGGREGAAGEELWYGYGPT